MSDTYVTIIGHAVGNDHDGFHVVHTWDGHTFADKAAAIANGFKAIGCDDFNVGVVRGGRLVSVWWMDKQVGEPPGELEMIGHEIGLEAS